MSAPLNGFWDVEDILFTDRSATGVPMLQTGNIQTGTVTDNKVSLWQSSGFIGFPAAPKDNKASQCLVLKTSSSDIAFAVRDVQNAKISGQMKMGETCVYAPGSQARALFKNDGSITLYTTDDNTETGKSVFVSVAPDGIRMGGPWGVLTIDANGIKIASQKGSAITLDSDATLIGQTASIRGAGNAFCTAGAINPAQGVAYSAAGPANLFSSTVIVSP